MVTTKQLRNIGNITRDDYIRTFSEKRKGGVRRIKFWGFNTPERVPMIQLMLRHEFKSNLISVVYKPKRLWELPALIIRVQEV